MKKSYINEQSLQIKVDIDLGEVNSLIEELAELTGEGSTHWRAKDLKIKLEKLRREAVEEARREFDSMLDKL